MMKIISICSLLVCGFAAYANAAPAVGEHMTETVTGMSLAWVPPGCFKVGSLGGTDAAVKLALRAPAKKPAAHSLIRIAASHGMLVQESDALDDGVGDVQVKQPALLDPLASQTGGLAGGQADGQTCVHGFWMGKFEVTQGQYQAVMGKNPSGFKKGSRYPVEKVRWLDVRSFIRRLNKKTGKHFRLPSEVEWEYAARSGGRPHLYGAIGRVNKVAWYMANSGNSTHPVGMKTANGLGLYDMSGNVWEWTQDCWNENLAAAPKDGSAQHSGNCSARVLRGGSWYDAKSMLRTTARLWNDSDKRDNNSGFRLVLDEGMR